ncbi:MAG TPA: GNAT family N-acetyltransferase [Flavobacterium sp.]|jgi:ribosomal protein S18 acetylase RimI-like enzyme
MRASDFQQSKTTVRQISTEDPLYAEERMLRNKVLLRPIGLADHAWEMHDNRAWHFVAFDGSSVIGCVLLLPLIQDPKMAQLLQMAVDIEYQGRGIGQLLIDHLVDFAAAHDFEQIICHARSNAVKFYEKNGFEVYGGTFIEVGLLHYHMKRNIKK